MVPGQVPPQLPWRDAHPFFLLTPLMGLLSWAWSRLRGPEPPEPWLVEAVRSADQGEAGLEGDTKAALATHYAPWGRYPQGKAGDGGTNVEDGESSWESCPDLKASSSLEAWGLSDDDNEECRGEEATSIPPEQENEYIHGQPAPLTPSLQRTLQEPPGEEESEEGGVAEDKAITFFSFPLSHWGCPGVEEEGEGKAGNTAPRAWVYCPRKEEAPTKEEGRTENKENSKASISSLSSGSHPSAWGCYSGEESEEEDGEADPGPHSSSLGHRPLLGTWQHQPKITEEDEEDEDSDSGVAEEEAEGPSSVPPTSTFLGAWVYRPGEDTEEEEEEEEEEDSDSGAAEEEEEEEEEAEGPSSIPPTSAFLRAWVYRPGEDTEEEEEEEEDEKDDSEAAGSGPNSSLQAQSARLRGWTNPPGKEAEEWGEAESHPFRVAIYLPGEKPPPPWALPRLPLRLQRRLKSAETPTQHLDPETPQKARKVHFSEKVSIHFLVVWAGPAQAARRGPWEQLARDRSRFARRIAQAQEKLGPYLTPVARARAWARLQNPSPSLAAMPVTTQTLPTSSFQGTPLSYTVASPSPLYVSCPPA